MDLDAYRNQAGEASVKPQGICRLVAQKLEDLPADTGRAKTRQGRRKGKGEVCSGERREGHWVLGANYERNTDGVCTSRCVVDRIRNATGVSPPY